MGEIQMRKFCAHCGAPVPDDFNRCTKCGLMTFCLVPSIVVESAIKRLLDVLQQIVVLLEDPADAEMAIEDAYVIANDALSDQPAAKTCVWAPVGGDRPFYTKLCTISPSGPLVGLKEGVFCPHHGLPIEIKE